MSDRNTNYDGFLLSLNLIYEKLHEIGIPVTRPVSDPQYILSGAMLYTDMSGLKQDFCYLTDIEYLRTHPVDIPGIRMVVMGKPADGETFPGLSCLFISKSYTTIFILNMLQQIFMNYNNLERRLTRVLIEGGGPDDICRIAIDHFGVPVFIHDAYYRILACPIIDTERMSFEYNERQSSYYLSASAINMLKFSPAYKKTLSTRGACRWESDYNDDSFIYANIRLADRYYGRFIVLIPQDDSRQSIMSDVNYFLEIISLLILQKDAPEELSDALEPVIRCAAVGDVIHQEDAELRLASLGWEMNGRYLAGIAGYEESELARTTAFSICSNIEKTVNECYTTVIDTNIYLLINMDTGHHRLDDIRQKLSYIIRENVLTVGISAVFNDISDLNMALRQARVALRYGLKSSAPRWYNTFYEHALHYWIMEGLGEFTAEEMIPPFLRQLKDYDKLHSSELYRTLQVYLVNERSRTISSQVLGINRSTLQYRLDKIQTMADSVSLSRADTRLYFLLGFKLDEMAEAEIL